MCQECIAIEKQFREEAEEVEEQRIQETLDRIVHEMATNPNWQELARQEIRKAGI